MLGLLPFICLLALVTFLGNVFPRWGWRTAIIRGVIIWGTYLTLSTELLSLLLAINPIVLAAVWLIPTLTLILLTRRAAGSWQRIKLPRLDLPADSAIRWMLLGILAFATTTAVVAWIAPPNTYDSLTYHMGRVVHWAQNGSVNPYSTGILRQLFMSPGAEFAVLHTYVLSGGDRLANLVQWFAMIVSIIAVTSAARELGASTRGQSFAAVFAVTLPVGIAQASSTMTDYMVAMWVVIVGAELLRFYKQDGGWSSVVFMSMAAGLAILTKPTSLTYLLPLVILTALVLLSTQRRRQIVLMTLVALGIVLSINAGYLLRNLTVFGSPLGDEGLAARYRLETLTWEVVVSNVLRNASLHAGTPISELNDLLHTGLAKLHAKLGFGLDDPRTSVHPVFIIWSYLADELRASNTLQAILALFAFGGLLIKRRTFKSHIWLYATASAAGFLLFSIAFKFDLLGSRFHLPFFLLAAPLVATIIERVTKSTVTLVLSGILAIGGLPILVGLGSRPLISKPNAESILGESRLQLYFAQAPNLDEPYREIVDLIQREQCDQVGLMLSGDSPEYPLWVLMGAPNESLTMEWIIARSDPSGSYRSEEFTPCAMVCGSCPSDWIEFRDMPLIYNDYGHRLFLDVEE